MDPDSRTAHFYRAQALEATGRPADAAAAYRAALAISPDFFPALFHRGRALLLAGDPASAIPDLERAVALAPAEQPPKDLLAAARARATAAPR